MSQKELLMMETDEDEVSQGLTTTQRVWDSQPTYLLIDEFDKFLQSIICCDPTIQGLCKLFNFSFKTARLFCEMIQKVLNIFW